MSTNFSLDNISSIKLNGINYNIKTVPFHATESEWASINYVPKQSEFIVYDIDENNAYPRFKTGDGITEVNKLPFTLTTISEVQSYVANQIGSAGHLKRVVLEEGADLPAIDEADADTIYMKKNNENRLVADVYEEYMVIGGAWEIIGTTKVNLENYATTQYVDEKISNVEIPIEIYKQDEAPSNPKEGMLWLDTDDEGLKSDFLSGLSQKVDKEILVKYLFGILRACNFKTDQTLNIDLFEIALGGGSGIKQEKNLLKIYKANSIVQNENTLNIS